MRRSASSRGCSLTTSTSTFCVRGPKRPRDNREAYAAHLVFLEAAKRQIAEHQAVAGRGARLGERAFHFEPLEGNAGHPVLLCQRIHVLLLSAVGARSEEAHRIGLDGLVGSKQYFHFLDGRLGSEVECRERAGLAGALGVDTDGFVAAAGPDFIGIRPMVSRRVQVRDLFRAEANVIPVVDSAAAHPDRVALHPDAIAARGGDAETAPAKSARVGEDARDTADGLALFHLRIGDGAAAGANIRLSVRIQHGEVQAVCARVPSRGRKLRNEGSWRA